MPEYAPQSLTHTLSRMPAQTRGSLAWGVGDFTNLMHAVTVAPPHYQDRPDLARGTNLACLWSRRA